MGATANLTASRISFKNMRKLRLFERDAYVSVDLLAKQVEIVKLGDHNPAAPGPFQLPYRHWPAGSPDGAAGDYAEQCHRKKNCATLPVLSAPTQLRP